MQDVNYKNIPIIVHYISIRNSIIAKNLNPEILPKNIKMIFQKEYTSYKGLVMEIFEDIKAANTASVLSVKSKALFPPKTDPLIVTVDIPVSKILASRKE